MWAVAWMYGIAGMPIADANALMFTMPLFPVILAAIWLAERPGIHRISATIFGFAGALIILRPGMIEISMAAGNTVRGRHVFGRANRQQNAHGDRKPQCDGVLSLYVDDPPGGYRRDVRLDQSRPQRYPPTDRARRVHCRGATVPDPRVSGGAGQLVVIVNYVQLPLIALFGWLIFAQSTDLWTWAGAAVICTSTYYVSYRRSERPDFGRQQMRWRKIMNDQPPSGYRVVKNTKPRIRHTMLRVKDLEKSIDFYTRLFGMKLFQRIDNEGGKYSVRSLASTMKIPTRRSS